MIKIDDERVEVRVRGKLVKLTNKEYLILKALLEADGRVLSRDRVMELVWKFPKSVRPAMLRTSRNVDQHIVRLRMKLGKVLRIAGQAIVTVPTRGYKLVKR